LHTTPRGQKSFEVVEEILNPGLKSGISFFSQKDVTFGRLPEELPQRRFIDLRE